MNVSYRHFQPSDLSALYPAFISAFSDYFVKFRPSLSQFRTRIFEKLHIHPELSLLALESSQVVGFILHTLGRYENQLTIYNGGMGVVPEYRNHQIASEAYQHIAPQLAQTGAKRIILEVIDSNEKAIALYEKLDFSYKQTFKCFKLHDTLTPVEEPTVRVLKSIDLKAEYQSFHDFEPSFLDTHAQLKFNLANEVILEAVKENELVGCLIFQPALGRISQLAVGKKYRHQKIATQLLYAAQQLSTIRQLTAMNIPEDQESTLDALSALGFVNEINQYEMELII